MDAPERCCEAPAESKFAPKTVCGSGKLKAILYLVASPNDQCLVLLDPKYRHNPWIKQHALYKSEWISATDTILHQNDWKPAVCYLGD